jgi:hypothetical protein
MISLKPTHFSNRNKITECEAVPCDPYFPSVFFGGYAKMSSHYSTFEGSESMGN